MNGRIVFPLPGGTERDHYDRILLGGKGTLWGWTVQRFRPGSPPYAGADKDGFRPFVVGFMEIPGEVIVEGYIEADPATLHVGQPMELTTRVLSTEADGTQVKIYAFRPTA